MKRINAKGETVESNFGISRESESTYRCGNPACRKVFSVFGSDEPGAAPKMKYYSLAADGNKIYALNRGRAQRHADRCSEGQES